MIPQHNHCLFCIYPIPDDYERVTIPGYYPGTTFAHVQCAVRVLGVERVIQID